MISHLKNWKRRNIIFITFATLVSHPLTAMEPDIHTNIIPTIPTEITPTAPSPKAPYRELWSTLLTYPTHNDYLATRDAIKDLIAQGVDINAASQPKTIVREPIAHQHETPRKTPLNWAMKGQHYDVYELLLEKGAQIEPSLDIIRTPRLCFITIKHLLRRVIVPHRTRIRTLLLCMNQTPAMKECARDAHKLLRKHLLIEVAADCQKTLEPYQILGPHYANLYGRESFNAETIQRFLDLFL